MTILLSELYGKEIITNGGRKIGLVEDLILDLEERSVSSLLMTKVDNLVRSANTPAQLAKNSVKYGRVRSVSQTIIVGEGDKIK